MKVIELYYQYKNDFYTKPVDINGKLWHFARDLLTIIITLQTQKKITETLDTLNIFMTAL